MLESLYFKTLPIRFLLIEYEVRYGTCSDII